MLLRATEKECNAVTGENTGKNVSNTRNTECHRQFGGGGALSSRGPQINDCAASLRLLLLLSLLLLFGAIDTFRTVFFTAPPLHYLYFSFSALSFIFDFCFTNRRQQKISRRKNAISLLLCSSFCRLFIVTKHKE